MIPEERAIFTVVNENRFGPEDVGTRDAGAENVRV